MNENDLSKSQQILLELSEILFAEDRESPLGKRLKYLSENETLEIYEYRQQIKGLFGGMGSINDIVIFESDGRLNREASTRFYELKEKLYFIIK